LRRRGADRDHERFGQNGERIVLGADATGAGPRVLLLPALSSISTRHDMRPLQERLSQRYAT
jgi:hypothetical protein